MKERTRRALIDLMIITDETPKDYKDTKKQAYYELMAFIKEYGDKGTN